MCIIIRMLHFISILIKSVFLIFWIADLLKFSYMLYILFNACLPILTYEININLKYTCYKRKRIMNENIAFLNIFHWLIYIYAALVHSVTAYNVLKDYINIAIARKPRNGFISWQDQDVGNLDLTDFVNMWNVSYI